MKELTAKQRNILDFLREFIEKEGYPPSLRDICDFFNINGAGNARKHLIALEKKGFIKRRPGSARAIDLISVQEGASIDKGPTHSGPGLTASEGARMSPVPILGRVRAGVPHLAVEDIEGHLQLDGDHFKTRGAFVLRAVGESMLLAGIDDGDLLVVGATRSASEGEIVVALIDGEATVKRFSNKGGSIKLLPENPLFEVITVSETREFAIVGKVVNVIKEL